MNRTLIFLLFLSLLFTSCANAQIANIISNDPALDQPEPALAANIIVGEKTNVVAFDAFTVVMGKEWNCLAVYSATGDSLVYWGDGNTFMLDTVTMACVGTNAYAKVNIFTGEGTVTIDGVTTICNKPQPTVVSQR